eukprot:3555690-Amphidinium_carterae.1
METLLIVIIMVINNIGCIVSSSNPATRTARSLLPSSVPNLKAAGTPRWQCILYTQQHTLPFEGPQVAMQDMDVHTLQYPELKN